MPLIIVEKIVGDIVVHVDQEEDGRFIAEAPKYPGAMSYGATQEQAIDRAVAIALRAWADQIEHRGDGTEVKPAAG